MNVFFLRTVPEVPNPSADIAAKLKVTVNNTGNYFFEYAVSRHLKGHVEINSIADLPDGDNALVLSMSNFINPYTDLGGIAQQIERKNVSRVIMIGAGAQAYDYGDAISVTPGTRRFLNILSERSKAIGVRGVYTAEVLEGMGIRNVEVIGCPSLFYNCDPNFEVKGREPIDGRRMRAVFHCTPSGFYRDCIAKLIAFGVANCESYVAQSETHLFGLHSQDEKQVADTKFFFKYYNEGVLEPEEATEWFRRNARWFFRFDEWLDYMRTVDFAFGARFHGNMAAILAGVPALSMVFDTRTRELCEYLNLPYMHLKDFRSDTTLSSLRDEADFSLFNATYPLKYKRYRDFLIANGLDVSLPCPGKVAERVETCNQQAARRILDDLIQVGSCNPRLLKELASRLEPARTEEERLLAQSRR